MSAQSPNPPDGDDQVSSPQQGEADDVSQEGELRAQQPQKLDTEVVDEHDEQPTNHGDEEVDEQEHDEENENEDHEEDEEAETHDEEDELDDEQQYDAEPGQPEGLVGHDTVLEDGFLFVCSVILNSPAFHANMQPGDVITQFGGMNKSNFPGLKALTDQVGACSNGSVIKCIVLRRIPNIKNEVYQRLETEMRVFRRPGGRGSLGMVINTWPPPRPLIIESPREARGAQPASLAATAASAMTGASTAAPTNISQGSGSRRGEGGGHSRQRSNSGASGEGRARSGSRGGSGGGAWATGGDASHHHQREGSSGGATGAGGSGGGGGNHRSRSRRSSTSSLPSTSVSAGKRN